MKRCHKHRRKKRTCKNKSNGEIVDCKEVALNVGETKTVEFRYVNNEPGTYTVEVNGKTSEYEVRKGWE